MQVAKKPTSLNLQNQLLRTKKKTLYGQQQKMQK
jgi:hypothetical protein